MQPADANIFTNIVEISILSETPGIYLNDSPLTLEQNRKLSRFLTIIRESGGFGKIEIEVKNGKIRFINLKEVRELVESS